MDKDARQRGEPSVREPLLSESNRVRRRQHQQQRQQQQEQTDPYTRVDRELPERQDQTRHPTTEDPRFRIFTGDQ